MPLYIGNKEVIKVYKGNMPFCKIYKGSVLKHWASDCKACVEYGYLYNWYAATDTRGIAASGWHVPTYEEIYTLITTLDPTGGYYANNAGGQGKETGTTYWDSPNTGATNSAGLYFRGSGFRTTNGVFSGIKQNSFIWSSTLSSPGISIGYKLQHDDDDLEFTTGYSYYGMNIRLVKDDSTLATYTGNDGKSYNTVKIGSQVWMAENLAETEFADHSKIPVVEGATTWTGLLTGGMCAYDNDYTNVGCGETEPELTEVKYGLLYNWYAVTDVRYIAPAGWHVPTDTELTTLIDWLTTNGYGYGGSGNDVAKSIASTSEWAYNGTPGNVGNDQESNNSSGFTMFPCGGRDDTGNYFNFGEAGFLWAYSLYFFAINDYTPVIDLSAFEGGEKYGFSLRLLKDDSTDTGTMVDNDGNIYPTVKIGDQVWMAKNLKTTKYRNGDAIPEVTDASAWVALTTGALCAFNNDWDNV